jgi:hypothetical protein
MNRLSSQDLQMEGGDLGSMHDSDFQDKKSRQLIQQRTNFQDRPIHTNHLPGNNFPVDLNVDSTGEAPSYNGTRNHRIGTKHGFERMRSDSASNPSDHRYHENNPAIMKSDPLLHGYNNGNVKNVLRCGYIKSEPSNTMHNSRISMDSEERGLSERMAKVHKYTCAFCVFPFRVIISFFCLQMT